MWRKKQIQNLVNTSNPINNVLSFPGVNKLRKGFVMTENEKALMGEAFVKCFAMPNCSACKHFELLGVFEFCNLHERITEGQLCNCFRIKETNS